MAQLDCRFVGTVVRVNNPFTKAGASWSGISMVVNGRIYVGASVDDVSGDGLPGRDYIDVVDLQLARFRQNDQADDVFNAIPTIPRGSEVSAALTLDTYVPERGGVALKIGPLQSLTVLSKPEVSAPVRRQRVSEPA